MITKLLDFIKKADKILLKNQGTSTYYFKNTNDIVTETDILISQLFKSFIEKNFNHLNYCILDEENIVQKDILKADYQFILDPIDGTLPYSLNMPLYGISIGVFKKGKPLYGFIYMPATKELLYCDTKSVYFTENAFLPTAKTQEITKSTKTKSNIIFDTLFFVIMKNSLLKEKLVCCSFYSTVVQMMYLATGRAKGAYFSGYLWDIAGSWCILKKLGYQIKEIKNGHTLSDISSKFFDKKSHIKGVFIISKPKMFKKLQNIAEIRT